MVPGRGSDGAGVHGARDGGGTEARGGSEGEDAGLTPTDTYIFFDCETTGTDPATDRIVQLSIQRLPPRGVDDGQVWTKLVNPGRPIPAEATEVHGITDEMVKDAPTFAELAPDVQATMSGGVLVTFNGRRFDTPLIDAELVRAGQPGLPKDSVGRIIVAEIDAYQLWIKSEPRTLEAAVERFCGRKLEDAHSSAADTEALPDLLVGICEAFDLDPDDTEGLCAITRPEDEIDRAGKFRKKGNTPVFAFGPHKDQPVRNHLDFVKWMLKKDFPEETKAVARYLIQHYRAKNNDQTDMGV